MYQKNKNEYKFQLILKITFQIKKMKVKYHLRVETQKQMTQAMNGAVLTCFTTNFNNMMANIYNDHKFILKNNIIYFT